VLAELDVPATFFFVGRNAREHPEIVRRCLADGHAIGSHSLTHPHPSRTGLPELTHEYVEGHDAVAGAAGVDVALFRPPHGYLTLRSALLLRRRPVTSWLWTVDPRDWRPNVSVEDVTEAAADAGSGDVILLHDWVEPRGPESLDRTATVEALPAIVRALRHRGLRFVTLASRSTDILNLRDAMPRVAREVLPGRLPSPSRDKRHTFPSWSPSSLTRISQRTTSARTSRDGDLFG
jgi:peptidoglycan/xylan/chitin deacetylase (PgdA/CDA1 family)